MYFSDEIKVCEPALSELHIYIIYLYIFIYIYIFIYLRNLAFQSIELIDQWCSNSFTLHNASSLWVFASFSTPLPHPLNYIIVHPWFNVCPAHCVPNY